VFRVGDEVVWITEAFHDKVGIVTNVIPNDRELSEFTLYDVTFDFGLRTLHRFRNTSNLSEYFFL
jgi:hypothetical protein